MDRFDFISDHKFRASLESDYIELTKAREHKLLKTVYVMSGSIIEAVLVDSLIAHGEPAADVYRLTFENLIKKARTHNYLDDRSESLAHVLRNYRNLIHKGRQERDSEIIDEEGADIAASLVGMIANNIRKNKSTIYGLTAETLVQKLISDTAAINIWPDLLAKANEFERRRLLLNVLPTTFLDSLSDPHSRFDWDNFQSCFRLLYAGATIEDKKQVANRHSLILESASQEVVRSYEYVFFLPGDLIHYSPEQLRLVKRYSIPALRSPINQETITRMVALANFLDDSEQEAFLEAVVTGILYQSNMPRRALLDVIKEAHQLMSETTKKWFEQRIDTAIEKSSKEEQFDNTLAILKVLKKEVVDASS